MSHEVIMHVSHVTNEVELGDQEIEMLFLKRGCVHLCAVQMASA